MGCDIHLFGEKKVAAKPWQFWKKSKWVSVDKYAKNPDYEDGDGSEREFKIPYEQRIYTGGRNYNLFCALAGVRSGHFKGEPPIVSKPKGIPADCCNEIKAEIDSYGSDGHSHSWLTLRELGSFDWSAYSPTTDNFIKEVLPKLKAQSNNPDDVRIVFFFDN